jgi:hypothetical protein
MHRHDWETCGVVTEDRSEPKPSEPSQTEEAKDGSVKIGGVFNIVLRPGLAFRRRKVKDVVDAARPTEDE